MATLQVTPDLNMYYEVTDFAEPWREHETILLLHGNAESGVAWYGWMPELTRDYRVVRPDMRGFGRSTPMARDYAWSLDRIVDDFIAVMDELKIDKFYLVGAKVGGTMALHLAARHPSRVKTVTVLSSPTRGEHAGDRYRSWVNVIEKSGVEGWARETMAKRLGSTFPPAGIEWWIKLMGQTASSTQLGFIGAVPKVDITADLPNIGCPAQVITTQDNPLYSVDLVRAWQQKIARSELLVLPGESYHVAATAPAACAKAVLDFIQRHSR
ncbi:MAG TPA: alpha/beta hydrolase [Burkholderiales bacterium]|nr:alpha/beta hydrolase [Burkholderiales bacterium]